MIVPKRDWALHLRSEEEIEMRLRALKPKAGMESSEIGNVDFDSDDGRLMEEIEYGNSLVFSRSGDITSTSE